MFKSVKNTNRKLENIFVKNIAYKILSHLKDYGLDSVVLQQTSIWQSLSSFTGKYYSSVLFLPPNQPVVINFTAIRWTNTRSMTLIRQLTF